MIREHHGLSKRPHYVQWRHMVQQCTDPTHSQYKSAGALGAKVHVPWALSYSEFERFVDSMGPRPSSKHRLYRFPEPVGDFKPGNLCWATPADYQRALEEKAPEVLGYRSLTVGSRTQSLQRWAEEAGVTNGTIIARLRRGCTAEAAVGGSTEKPAPGAPSTPFEKPPRPPVAAPLNLNAWLGNSEKRGTCLVWTGRPSVPASRVAWELKHKQRVPEGHEVFTTCEVLNCVEHVALRRKTQGPPKQQGERNHQAKLTAQDVEGARRLSAAGYSYKDLAEIYGVAYATIYNAVNRLKWKHIP